MLVVVEKDLRFNQFKVFYSSVTLLFKNNWIRLSVYCFDYGLNVDIW